MRRAQLALASLAVVRNSRKSPLEGIKSSTTLKTEASRTVTSYGHAQQLGERLNPEGAEQKAVATFPKSRSVLGQVYKVAFGGQ